MRLEYEPASEPLHISVITVLELVRVSDAGCRGSVQISQESLDSGCPHSGLRGGARERERASERESEREREKGGGGGRLSTLRA